VKRHFLSLLALAILVPLFALHASGQDLEEGSPSELKGLTKVFVNTNGSDSDRKYIVEHLERAGLTIVERSADAQIWITFKSTMYSMGLLRTGTGDPHRRINEKRPENPISLKTGIVSAAAKVACRISPSSKPRIVMTFEHSGGNPAIRFSKEFLSKLRKANRKT
jgi:hypothetical protein